MTALRAATFLLFQLLCQVLVTVGFGCELPSGYVKYADDNTAYKIHKEELEWKDARQQCISEGAHLVVAITPEKINHITNSREFPREYWVHTGVYRPTASRDWVSVDDGLPVATIPWTGFSNTESYDCAVLWDFQGGVTTDLDCEYRLQFVCETSIAEGCSDPVSPQGLQDTQSLKADAGSLDVDGPKGERVESGKRDFLGLSGKEESTEEVRAPHPQSLTEPTGTSGRVLPPGYVKFPEDNAAYKIYENFDLWNEAQERCIEDGAHLAVGTSLEKIQHINSTNPSSTRWVHGGIYRSATTGEWLRVDNDQPVPPESIRWYREPDKDGDCTVILMHWGKMINIDCKNQWLHSACEIHLNEGKPDPVGLQGLQGHLSSRSDTGSNGIVGPKGERGEPGERGLQGLPGPQGERGWTGATGVPGPRGYTGQTGQAGDRGPVGPAGPQGAKGEPGPPGPPGPGYNATWLALLAACREQGLVTNSIDGGESLTSFENDLIKQKCEEFVGNAYEEMRDALHRSVKPKVQEDVTARTCRDLYFADPDKPSGEYWIDPNEEDASDKILVYCDAETHSTCITPEISESKVITYEGHEREVWLSQLESGMLIVYGASSSQITALQFLSNHVEQNVTYRCLNSVGYFDAAGKTYERGLKLSAWNGVRLNPSGRKYFRYDVLSDECQNRSNEWKETTITYRTDKPVLLPVVDVALRDLGEPEKKAVIEIGEVCFT